MSGIPHKGKNRNTANEAFVDTSCITPLPSSQLLNEYAVKHDPHCVHKLIRNNSNNSEYWHKFTICNDSYFMSDSCSDYPTQHFILKVITDFVYPCELLPVYVTQKATRTFFLARNCLQAIIKLCEAGLSVPNPNMPDAPFKVVIIKDVLTIRHVPVINIELNILSVLRKRLTLSKLDLSRFHEDKELQEFCPLSQPKLLLYVLSLVTHVEQTSSSKILKIILSHNNIRNLPNLESLSERSFDTIDLSNNKIQNIEDIVPLKDLPNLTAVHLSDNPLCCRFDSGTTYFLYVKTICKNLMILDNKKLFEGVFYKTHRNFLCDIKGFDFANQFVEEYFSYYDEPSRPNIESYYSDDAMFSLSFRELIETSGHVGIDYKLNKPYRRRNRNLKLPYTHPLFYGKEAVLQELQGLPSTQHYPHTFNVDLMAYSKSQAIIHVTGVVKAVPKSRTICHGFTRNFVLSSTDGKEWVITNDQLFIYCPYIYHRSMASEPITEKDNLFPDPNCNLDHMTDLALTFESITGMAYEHSRRFLEKNSWCLELALKVFIDEHINNEIPDEAFNEKSKKEPNEESDDEDVIITEDDILPPIETLLTEESKVPVESTTKFSAQGMPVSARGKKTTNFPLQLPQSGSSGTRQNKNQTVVASESREPVQDRWSYGQMAKCVPSSYPSPTPLQSSLSFQNPIFPLSVPSMMRREISAKLIVPSEKLPQPSPLPAASSPQNCWADPLVLETSRVSLTLTDPLKLLQIPLPKEKKLKVGVQSRSFDSSPPPLLVAAASQDSSLGPLSEPEDDLPLTNLQKISQEREELAELVMSTPKGSAWSPELRARLAALRPPRVPPNKRFRAQLRTRAGKTVNVTIPSGLTTAISTFPSCPRNALTNSSSLPSKNPMKKENKLNELVAAQPRSLDSSASPMLVAALSQNSSIASLSEPEEVPSLINLQKISQEREELAELVMHTPKGSAWSPELRARLAALRPPGVPPKKRFRIHLRTRAGKTVNVTIPSGLTTAIPTFPSCPQNALTNSSSIASKKPMVEENKLNELVTAQHRSLDSSASPMLVAPLSQNSSIASLSEPEEVPSLTNLQRISQEREELAELVMLTPKGSAWSPELRARLAALRPPGVPPKKRFRIQLRTRAGKTVNVTIPSGLTTAIPTFPSCPQNALTNSSSIPSKKPMEEENKLNELVTAQHRSLDSSGSPMLVAPLSQNSSIASLSEPEEVPSLTNLQKISQEREELAELVMLTPKGSDWSPELRARLAALRPPGEPPTKRFRTKLRTRAGKVVRITLPYKLTTPTSTLPS